MIKKTLFFSKKYSISTKNLQLVIKNDTETRTIPIEDIGYVVLENQEIYISIPAISQLVSNNVAVIFCDNTHMPQSMLLNLDGHYIQQEIFKEQIAASAPLKKQLWQQVIQQKITNQGLLLDLLNKKEHPLAYYSSKVLSGDSSNREAVAASYYWKNLFGFDFVRMRNGDYPNAFLNYGYTILRAATARALSGSGLLNTLGIHHKNKYNAFALADDIMEPYRPAVDEAVLKLIHTYDELILTSEMKADLLQVLTRTVYFKDEKSPLMVGLQKTASSLQQCFTGQRKKIKYPALWN
ncbi:type II CRISPR-associated endonuclease Cas1 [Polaribacter sp.]|uniref:type II CRISPR-associated endonuclease Cas1 n=1 Tax=Polaribacter sp. TaxID=1920175 RepID=UPI0040484974